MAPKSETGQRPVWETTLSGGLSRRNKVATHKGVRERGPHGLEWSGFRGCRAGFRFTIKRIGMSGSFQDREKAFESKWAHDEELRFKIMARRNKLLGLWAAEQMGITGAETDEYAKAVVRADFEEPGEEDVFRKVHKDFEAKGIARSDHAIRIKMDELLATATDQILHETGK